eukprot:6207922-Pleurochrysis_carterae.AAC.2
MFGLRLVLHERMGVGRRILSLRRGYRAKHTGCLHCQEAVGVQSHSRSTFHMHLCTFRTCDRVP